MPEDFRVKVGEIEGPLELILDLIEKRKLHISNISLSQIAYEFIEHIKSFESELEANQSNEQKKGYVSNIADFILVASTLLLIKSKSLLPNLNLTQEEEESIEDLEHRLNLYQQYKQLALGLGKLFGNFAYFAREPKISKVIFAPTAEITLVNLKNALNEALQNIPQKKEELQKVVVKKIISLEETISKLSERVTQTLKTSFKDFAGIGKVEKVNVIVSFLAMLELVKQGIVRVNQDNHFDDISIESEGVSVPKY
jgi:segregation and condensation protein A